MTYVFFIFPIFFSSIQANIIENGDFENGDLSSWYCPGSKCEVTNGFLEVTERTATWGGARQDLNGAKFGDAPLHYWLNFSIMTTESSNVLWKIRTENNNQTKYRTIFEEEVSPGDWVHFSKLENLDPNVKEADLVVLYLDVEPKTSNYNLDNVIMDIWTPDDTWKQDVGERIDSLRKRDIKINLINFEDTELIKADVRQINHQFPFGHAVASQLISDCEIAGIDDEFCTHVKENYNWIVDTYRMKWKAIEPKEGDFITDVPDNMIAWAKKNNITVRGHSLLWSKFNRNPEWTYDYFGEEFSDLVYKHIDDVMEHFNALNVEHWDVINEMIDEGPDTENHTFYIDQSGNPNMRVDIHNYVREKYPQNKFYINDYGIIMDKGDRFSLFQELLRGLFEKGVEIDGIGLQSHLKGEDIIDFNLIKVRVEALWEEFQIPMWITEFDWNKDGDYDWGDYSVYAQILDDFYHLMFSQELNANLVLQASLLYPLLCSQSME